MRWPMMRSQHSGTSTNVRLVKGGLERDHRQRRRQPKVETRSEDCHARAMRLMRTAERDSGLEWNMFRRFAYCETTP